MPPGERYFEVVKPGGSLANRVTELLLVAAADYFYNGNFAASEQVSLERNGDDSFINGVEQSIYFGAFKEDDPEALRDGEVSTLSFEVSVEMSRPWTTGSYIPGTGSVELTDREELQYDFLPSDVNQGWRIAEVHTYELDNCDFVPHKTIKWEYYNTEGDLAAIIEGVGEPGNLAIPADTKQEETDFGLWECELADVFTRDDVAEIIGALSLLGFRPEYSWDD